MPKRSTKPITKSRVDAMKQSQQLWDTHVIGFGIIANKNSKSFKLKYRYKTVQRMLTIGTYGSPFTVETARNEATRLLGLVKSGTDPAARSNGTRMTMSELCDEYLREHARPNKKPSSVQQDEMNIRNHIKPLLGKRLVLDIVSKDIETFKQQIQRGITAPKNPKIALKERKAGASVRGGKGSANRCLALLSKMFSVAELWGSRPKGQNPVIGVAKFKETSLERYLSADELKLLWEYLNKSETAPLTKSSAKPSRVANQFAVAAIKLLLLTGARKNEILTLKWSMVNFAQKRLELPDSKTGKKTIQLAQSTVDILRDLPRISGNPYVITGQVTGGHLKNLQKIWKRIREDVGISDVRIHDLRHSFASTAAEAGVPLHTIGKLMGHKTTQTTNKYAHLSDHYLAEQNEKISAKIGGVNTKSSGDEN